MVIYPQLCCLPTLLLDLFTSMSAFSFDTLNGAMLEPVAMDDTANLNYLVSQAWTDNDFCDPTYGISYASSNSSFSCGSLTSGCLTPQSSMSASNSRRHSLVSGPKPTSFFGSSAIRPKYPTTPRTPTKPEDSSSPSIGTQTGYSYSTPISQSRDVTFALNPEDINLSGKLHLALGIGEASSAGNSFCSEYDQGEVVSPRTSFGSEHVLRPYDLVDSEYSDYVLGRSSYQDLTTSSALKNISDPQPWKIPQTIAPSQTTFKFESTPPPEFVDPFVSPAKLSFKASPIERESTFIDQSQRFKYADDSLWRQNNSMSDDSGDFRASRSCDSEEDEAPSIFNNVRPSPKRKPRRKSQINRSGIPIKREPGAQHRCPICVEKTCFKRPEHLTRHIMSKHDKREDLIVYCQVPGCGTAIRGRPDNMTQHYKKTHLYGDRHKRGKKNIWVSIERARELGLEKYDPRVNPPHAKVKKET